jgi:hypothetical protein
MPNKFSDATWNRILRRIEKGKCTPFLGSGINHGILPTGSELAKELAKRFHYPLKNSSDLPSVTQYLAVTEDSMFPKEETLDLLRGKLEQWKKTVKLPDFFKAQNEPLGILASLPFPIYITTNYDDLMVQALKAWEKQPQQELCDWNKYVDESEYLTEHPSAFDSTTGYEPTVKQPLIFHLHGHDKVAESLVLTEDCYYDFMVNISKREGAIPARIQHALAGSSLLFIGYRLADFDFHVIHKGLIDQLPGTLRRASLSVQLPPEGSSQQNKQRQLTYLTKRFDKMDVAVFWGTAKEFAVELLRRWRKYTK